MNALFIFLYLNVINILMMAIKTVLQSIIVSFPIATQIETIIAIEATLTASKKVENTAELRIFFTNGFSKATKINEGKKMAIVDSNAPEKPLI